MGRADRTLYASVRRLVREFQRAQLPFTGVAGTRLACWELDPRAAVAAWFRRPAAAGAVTFEEGIRLLPRMQAQLEALQGAEEQTLEALAEWSALAGAVGRRGLRDPFAAAAAAEEGIALLAEQITLLTDPFKLDDVDPEDEDAPPPLTLDGMAGTARERHPGLFADDAPGAGGGAERRQPSQQQLEDRLHALADVLYAHLMLKCTPFEWVYDGMKPLLLPEVLKRRKGAPAAVAVAAAAVGRRLGVPLLPLPAAPVEAGAEGGIASVIPPENLPPGLVLKFANRAQAVAPGPGPWLLRLDGGEAGDGAGEGGALHLDAGSGEVLSGAAAAERYPTAAGTLAAGEWRRRSALATWQGLARLALQAHQRRGESDFVAHWMYLGMALDPGAPEWRHVLAGPELAAG